MLFQYHASHYNYVSIVLEQLVLSERAEAILCAAAFWGSGAEPSRATPEPLLQLDLAAPTNNLTISCSGGPSGR